MGGTCYSVRPGAGGPHLHQPHVGPRVILPIVQAVGTGMSISDLYPVSPLRSHAACISCTMGEVLANFCACAGGHHYHQSCCGSLHNVQAVGKMHELQSLSTSCVHPFLHIANNSSVDPASHMKEPHATLLMMRAALLCIGTMGFLCQASPA